MWADPLSSWALLGVSLAALILSHRLATQLLITLLYRATHSLSLSMLVYALLIWPGTALHEVSHWLVARMLGVYAEPPHLLPSAPDAQGRMVLGHVLVERSDPVRRSLIGVSPLLFGSVAILVLARYAFALPFPDGATSVKTLSNMVMALPTIVNVPNGWLYLYLVFAVANGMMPSRSDREAWPTLLLFILLVTALLFFTLGIPQVPPTVSALGQRLSTWLAFAFVITALLDAVLALFLFPLENLLKRLGR